MKSQITTFLLGVTLASPALAQIVFPVTPATPTDFETKDLGNSLSSEGLIKETPPPQTIRKTFTLVTPVREWRNAKGVIVKGALVAFEAGDHSKSDHPLTLVHEGKVRLLVDGKKNYSLIALSSLSKADRDYINAQIAARAKK